MGGQEAGDDGSKFLNILRVDLSEFYTYIKERGYVLYPGKLTDADTFRVGNIGEIYPEDIEKLASIIAGFLAAHKEEIA